MSNNLPLTTMSVFDKVLNQIWFFLHTSIAK